MAAGRSRKTARAGHRMALLDVNVLVALFDPAHIHHDVAHDWFADDGARGWATCPTTEMGFVRVVSNPKYGSDPVRAEAALTLLRRFCENTSHRFWPDRLSFRDPEAFALGGAQGHRQLTDIYLLALAKAMGGRLATLDRTIPLAAAKARTDHLTVIAPTD